MICNRSVFEWDRLSGTAFRDRLLRIYDALPTSSQSRDLYFCMREKFILLTNYPIGNKYTN